MQDFSVHFVFCVVFCYSAEAGESQFNLLRQSHYDVKIELARLGFVNSSYVKYAKLDAVPYNRTFRVLNASFELFVDLNNQVLASVTTSKFLSNEYRFFPMSFEFDLCTEYNHDSFGLKQMFDRYTNYQPCFVKKDVHYRFIHASPDVSKFPPHVPLGRYSINIDALHKKNRNSMGVIVVNFEVKSK